MRLRTTLATLLAVAAGLTVASTASAAPTGSVDADFDARRDPAAIGIKGALSNIPEETAGYFYMRVEGEIVRVMCIQPEVSIDRDRAVSYKADKYSNLRVGDASRLPAVKWFMGNQTYGLDGHPTGNALGTEFNGRDGIPSDRITHADAATAQIAVWNYVNGMPYDQVPSTRAQARVADFLSHLSDPANRVPEGAHDFEITATLRDDSMLEIATYGFVGDTRAPLMGVEVTITSSATDLDTATEGLQTQVTRMSDARGRVELPGIAPTADDVLASAGFVLPRGTILTDVEGTQQQVITVDPAAITREVQATPAVVAEAAPEAAESAPLPQTGGKVTVGLLLVAAVAGLGGFVALRRKAA